MGIYGRSHVWPSRLLEAMSSKFSRTALGRPLGFAHFELLSSNVFERTFTSAPRTFDPAATAERLCRNWGFVRRAVVKIAAGEALGAQLLALKQAEPAMFCLGRVFQVEPHPVSHGCDVLASNQESSSRWIGRAFCS